MRRIAMAVACFSGVAFGKYLLAEHFDNATLQGCSSAPACGVVMASIDGIPARSNGGDQCTGECCGGEVDTGCAYQCVELAQRYMHDLHGLPGHWGVAYALQMCNTYPPQIEHTSNPGHGDLMVFSWAPYGHVAVIDSVAGDTVYVVEQNNSPDGRNAYPKSQAECFLSLKKAKSCAGLPNGFFCGSDGVNGDPNTLYFCDNQAIKNSTVCADACEVMPTGFDDRCITGSCANLPDGYFCGSDGIGGDAEALYFCNNKHITSCTRCAKGCHVAPHGENDYCNN